MERLLHIHQISLGIGVVGIGVILWGLLLGLAQLVGAEYGALRGRDTRESREVLRSHLGYYLLLGLEFLVAADIVDTILGPSLQELAVLGAIVAIRTVISFSLNRELASAESRGGS